MQEVNLCKICAIKVRRQTTVNLSKNLKNRKFYFTNFIENTISVGTVAVLEVNIECKHFSLVIVRARFHTLVLRPAIQTEVRKFS
jgi:hypothetical protein